MAMSTARPALVDTLVVEHLTRGNRDTDLITVCATPQGLSSYVAGGGGTRVADVRHEHGAVVVRAYHDEYGTLVSILGGPAVIEVALHASEEQQAAYRMVLSEIDAETREQALASVQAAAVGMLRELGVTVDDRPAGVNGDG